MSGRRRVVGTFWVARPRRRTTGYASGHAFMFDGTMHGLATLDSNLLFANGGVSDGRWSHAEPPADALALLQFKIELLEYRLADSQKRVETNEGYVRQQSQWYAMGAGPMPEGAAYEELKKKRAEVQVFNRQLTKARQELRRRTGPSQRESFEAQAAGRQRAAEAAMARAFNS